MLLYGAGGHAKVVLDGLKTLGIEIPLIFDDDTSIRLFKGIPVQVYQPSLFANEHLLIAIGENSIRKKLALLIHHSFATFIHPSAYFSAESTLDEGTVLLPLAIVQTDSKIGKHVILNTKSIIEHDCQIEDFVHIAPNATVCGGVKIGEGSLIGAGSVILPNMKIGKWCILGAGAVLTTSLPDNTVAVGNPAKIIQYLV